MFVSESRQWEDCVRLWHERDFRAPFDRFPNLGLEHQQSFRDSASFMEGSTTMKRKERRAIEFLVREKAAKLFLEEVLGISMGDAGLSVCIPFLSTGFTFRNLF
jgi:hypothetical protein